MHVYMVKLNTANTLAVADDIDALPKAILGTASGVTLAEKLESATFVSDNKTPSQPVDLKVVSKSGGLKVRGAAQGNSGKKSSESAVFFAKDTKTLLRGLSLAATLRISVEAPEQIAAGLYKMDFRTKKIDPLTAAIKTKLQSYLGKSTSTGNLAKDVSVGEYYRNAQLTAKFKIGAFLHVGPKTLLSDANVHLPFQSNESTFGAIAAAISTARADAVMAALEATGLY